MERLARMESTSKGKPKLVDVNGFTYYKKKLQYFIQQLAVF